MATFGELKTTVSYMLDDLQFGYFTEIQVGLWLNQSQKRVQKLLLKAGQNYYQLCAMTTLVVNQRDYVLPADFKQEHRLELVIAGTNPNETTSALIPITTMQQDLVPSGVGTPAFYEFRKNRIILRPAPDLALPMRLFYSYEVPDMTLDSDIPDVPDSYHELIALYAAEIGFIKDGRVSTLLEKRLKEVMDELESDSKERNKDVPRGITETGHSDYTRDIF